ncbi:unnamed protein product [Prunus armeniaca]
MSSVRERNFSNSGKYEFWKGSTSIGSNSQGNNSRTFNSSDLHSYFSCIIDFGATNRMTFDSRNFTYHTSPHLSSVANANGDSSPVTGTGTVELTPLSLHHCLLVPSLPNNILSVGQIVSRRKSLAVLLREADCIILMIFVKAAFILPKVLSKIVDNAFYCDILV